METGMMNEEQSAAIYGGRASEVKEAADIDPDDPGKEAKVVAEVESEEKIRGIREVSGDYPGKEAADVDPGKEAEPVGMWQPVRGFLSGMRRSVWE
ncbi:MAG: hypothetical protein NC342_09315 [Pseudoflavonifractor sp.]|nr:hypothetical protein [Alloprevotella sp.]MCM1117718.1 hypothetical protein [Pseudoflavonifractor sp.]